MMTRQAVPEDAPVLAALWRSGWEDAHNGLLPEALVRLRTAASFQDRVLDDLASFQVVGPPGRPQGFFRLRGDELDQFYVGREARGSGLAGHLLNEAETHLSQAGVRDAWLACAIGNARAARFYEKHGWRLAGEMTHHPETAEGPIPLQVWRYEKTLTPTPG